MARQKFIPVDRRQCQVEERSQSVSFMTLGPAPPLVRCKDLPTVIAKEKKPGKDGRKGSMSMCTRHQQVFEKDFPNTATFHKIRVRR